MHIILQHVSSKWTSGLAFSTVFSINATTKMHRWYWFFASCDSLFTHLVVFGCLFIALGFKWVCKLKALDAGVILKRIFTDRFNKLHERLSKLVLGDHGDFSSPMERMIFYCSTSRWNQCKTLLDCSHIENKCCNENIYAFLTFKSSCAHLLLLHVKTHQCIPNFLAIFCNYDRNAPFRVVL